MCFFVYRRRYGIGRYNMSQQDAKKRYPTDVTDAEWSIIAPIVAQRPGRGRKRTVNIREVVNAIFYLNKTGCQWEMLPKEFPDYRHVNYYYLQWTRNGLWDLVEDLLRQAVRSAEGRDSEPTAAIMDSQSIKTTGKGEERGYDSGKQVKGRKRHLLVDTLGLIRLVFVTSASIQDRDGGADICDAAQQQFPKLKKIWADSAYRGELVEYVAQWCRFALEIVPKPQGQRGFQVQPKRWIVERTLGWLNLYRRLSKDYERRIESSEAMIKIASIRIMLRRLVSADNLQPNF
jgi:putative transposase